MATSVASPRRSEASTATAFADDLIAGFASAADLRDGMTAVVAGLRASGGAVRVEWWAPDEAGHALCLVAAAGGRHGHRSAFPLGSAGVLVVSGDDWSSPLALTIARIAPVVRRRFADERLAEHAARLVDANAALEDYAEIVARRLKSPLTSALQQADPAQAVGRALSLVDSLLAAARSCAPIRTARAAA